MSTPFEPVFLYTDGACSPNPGKGGYGIVIVENGKRCELSGGFKKTTNNRMELLSVIAGLKTIQGERRDVLVISDSRYVVDAYNSGHAKEWQSNNWMRTKRAAAKNPDLWHKLLAVCETHNVVMNWVAGHAGHEENERCDTLAVEARLRDDLPDDEGYLKPFTVPAKPQSQLDLF